MSETGRGQLPGVAQLLVKSRRAMRKVLIPEKKLSQTLFGESKTHYSGFHSSCTKTRGAWSVIRNFLAG